MEEITAETAGKDWIPLKAAALSLKLQVSDGRADLKTSLRFNAALAIALLVTLLCWQPRAAIYWFLVAISVWACLAIFIILSTIQNHQRMEARRCGRTSSKA
jgi:fatty acid desaturase